MITITKSEVSLAVVTNTTDFVELDLDTLSIIGGDDTVGEIHSYFPIIFCALRR